MIVRIAPAAQADIAGAYSWYEDQRKGLGDEFIDSVNQAVDRMGFFPQSYPNIFGDTRRCVIKRFPYALFYRAKNDVVVVACLHQKRNPRVAKERGPGTIPFPD